MIRKTKYVYWVYPGQFVEYTLEDAKRRLLKVCDPTKSLDNSWIDKYEVKSHKTRPIATYRRMDSSNGRMRWSMEVN